jgi:hypothetical protein
VPHYVFAVAGLIEETTGEQRLLEGETLVGRRANCHLHLNDACISSLHALLRWQEGQWYVRDLNSTNGTWVNGKRLLSLTDVALAADDRLSFGDPEKCWILACAAPPVPMATPLSKAPPQTIEGGIIRLPLVDEDFASIFRGPDGQWCLESRDENRVLQDGESFSLEGDIWRFSCPNQWQGTTRIDSLRLINDCKVIFSVSTDEERVEVAAGCEEQRLSLGHQTGYYFLLLLARQRLKDAQAGSDCGDAGWQHRDDLKRMLRCTETQLNVWICRIRSRFEAAGFLDYASIVERREGTGRMRIGAQRLEFNAL